MFIERLSHISNRIEGAIALSLVANDGITIESVNSDPDLDLDVLAAELIAQVQAIADNANELEVGALRQLTVRGEHTSILVSAVSDNHYLMLVLAAGGNHGRARFELRRAGLSLGEDLD